jgi:AraC-like DNA-binding protein
MAAGPYALSNIDWLLREAMDARVLKTSDRMVIDDASWRATIERIDIGTGLRVFLTDAEARHDITIEARDDRADQWVGSQVTVAGHADIDFLDGEKTYAAPAQALLFRPSGRCAAYSIKAGERFHSAGYNLDIARVRRLFEDDVPEALGPLLDPGIAASRVLAMRAARPMRTLAEGLFDCGFNGPLRILMIEGAVLQLLAVQSDAVARPLSRRSRAFSAQERKRIDEARDRLLTDMRCPPTLGELALAVGLSEKRLNAGFRALFGATVFEVLRNERLDHARIAIAEGARLQEVALRVGYNHPNNFIRAFAARYGTPPQKYFKAATFALARLPRPRSLKN